MHKRPLAAAASLAVLTSFPAGTHTLWINVIPEPGKHVIASIGYGDTLPGSEILTPDWGPMQLEAYDLISPEGKSSSLGVPRLVTHEKKVLEGGVSAQADPDSGVRKLVVPPGARKGAYQLAARTPLIRLVHYRDKQGKSRYSEAPVSTLKEVAEVLDTKLELNLMKAAFVAGGWTEPAPLGHALEIVPLSDLGAARTGDVVRFKVLLDGKAWNPSEGEAYITAHNAAFGKRWGLHSTLEAGEGEFRIPTAGPWRVDAAFRGINTDVVAYKNEGGPKGEPLPLLIESTFVFYVAP